MIFQSRMTTTLARTTSFSPPTRTLQRKCACGGTPGPSGECADCKRKRLALQPKLAINQPGDPYEQEADRVADAVVGAAGSTPAISSLGHGTVQREDPSKPKTEAEKYKEAAKMAGEAFLETSPGKEITKKAKELGDAFISTSPGKIITGTAVAGAIATLAAPHKELPIGIPEIPLDKIKPGLKMNITYEGPVDKPSKVVVGFTIPLGGKSRARKGVPTESENRQEETDRLAIDQAKFRAGLKSDEEKAADQKQINNYVASRILHPEQFTPRTSPLSFGTAGEQLGFHPGVPAAGSRRSLGPIVPDFKLSGEAPAVEPKKKEETTLRRKPAHAQETAGAPPIVDDVLQSPGELLASETRRFMEERFGHDFGSVRVHRDGRAVASARSVNALAYTVGRDIVFNAGAFAPESTEGRHLLAHELTHVVQQNSLPQTVQRVVQPGLEVKGRQTGIGDTSSGAISVFFERNGSALDSDGKVAVLLAGGGPDNRKNLDLHGYISEDEATTPAVGQALATSRIQTVDAELQKSGHLGKRNLDPKPDVGNGRRDYRSVRAVEMSPAGAKAATPDCKVVAAGGPCSGKAETDFTETRKQAQGLIDQARRLLTSGTDAQTNDLRDEFFGGAGGKGSGATITATLDSHLGRIRSQMNLNAKPAAHNCATICDSVCSGAVAYNQDVGPAAKMTLCPGFLGANPRERTRVFIHETAHGTAGLGLAGNVPGTDDLAYRYERRLPLLSANQALQNSDSYALFVTLAADPATARPQRPHDKIESAVPDKSGVEEMLASLSEWLKWSNQELLSTYSDAAKVSNLTKTWAQSAYEPTMKLIAAQFGLASPPAAPSADDRFALAGISDRYQKLRNLVTRTDLKVSRAPAGTKTSWSAGPGDIVILGNDFFSRPSGPARTRFLLYRLVEQFPAIESGQRLKFVQLAEQLNALHPLP